MHSHLDSSSRDRPAPPPPGRFFYTTITSSRSFCDLNQLIRLSYPRQQRLCNKHKPRERVPRNRSITRLLLYQRDLALNGPQHHRCKLLFSLGILALSWRLKSYVGFNQSLIVDSRRTPSLKALKSGDIKPLPTRSFSRAHAPY